MKFIYKLTFILSFFTYPVLAQNYVSKPISINKILGNNNILLANVRSIVKDDFGFLWLATQDGLFKYDGINLIKFNVNEIDAKKKLLSNDASDIYFDSKQNCIFVLSAYLGVSKINVRTNTVVQQSSDSALINFFSNSPATRITGNKDALFISTNDGKLIKLNFSLNKYSQINTTEKGNSRIEFVEALGDFIFWGVEGGNIFYLNKNQNEIYNFKSTINSKKGEFHFYKPFCDSNKILVPSSEGLLEINLDFLTNQISTKTLISGKKINYVYALKNIIYYASNNSFWGLDQLSNKLYKYEVLKNVDDEKWLASPTSITNVDSTLFIGSAQGLCVLKPNKENFLAYSLCKNNINLKIKHAVGITPYNNQSILIADLFGLYIYDVNKLRIKEIISKKAFYSVFKVEDEFMASGPLGTFFFDNHLKALPKSKYRELNVLSPLSITQIESNTRGQYYLASYFAKGFFVWNHKNNSLEKVTLGSTNKNLSSGSVNRFVVKKDRLYIICDNALSIMDLKTHFIKNYKINNPNNSKVLNIIMDICFVDQDIWLAVYGIGLVQLDQDFKVKKIVDNKNGLTNLGLYKIFSIGDSTIITTSNNGLFLFNVKSNNVSCYYDFDGLHGNGFEQFSGSNFGDKIIVGGIGGFTLVDPSKFSKNNAIPKLYFQDINILSPSNNFDTTNVFIQSLQIPNTVTQTKISFIGLNYQNPNRVNYWYKINELGSNWIDLKNQNFITLIGISPGKYHLQVKAANEDGLECAPISMELHFLPKWYQTLLFKTLVALLIVTTLYILYSFRIRQLEKVLAVRQKISQNLHDDIGSTLSAINMYTQVAKLQPQENDFINSIEENTQDALGKLDDIIWSTNPKNDKIKNLVERMDGFARPLLQAKNIQFKFTHSNIIDEQKIGEAIRQNLFIIFKEAINNVAKYADCTTCTVVLEEKNKNIYCTITDDGKGFDVTKPTERNGILNMKLRTKEMKGSFNIVSSPLKGTTIKVQLPV